MSVTKLPTGIGGLDDVTHGGLPEGRTTLVAGTAGSAKTVLAAQFLASGIARGEKGVFVTFEEEAADLRKNLLGFGWDIASWEEQGLWRFIDSSPDAGEEGHVLGSFDFAALSARIDAAVHEIGATRVSLDSIASVFMEFPGHSSVRQALRGVASRLRLLGVTALITAERTAEYGDIARFGVEEFVADNVLILRNALEDETCRRTIQVLKLRGANHRKGQFPFTVDAENAITVLPLTGVSLDQHSTMERITSGVEQLDAMCEGGFFRDSIILVSGATGTGKTLTTTEFLKGGAASGEVCLLAAFEESRDQLMRNANGWGVDFAEMERAGLLHISCTYPEELSLEEHLVAIKANLDRVNPTRFALDSLSALERTSTERGYRQFIIGLTSWLKDRGITGMFTSTTPNLLGGESVTTAHISTLTDTIVLLRYVEAFGAVRRSLAVLKMRGSGHDKEIREVTIDASGMHIGKAFRSVGGILAGQPMHVQIPDIDRLEDLLGQE